MDRFDLALALLALETSEASGSDLEGRIKNFLESDLGTENLDDAKYSVINGSKEKADYLLAGGRLVAELKTLNNEPIDPSTKLLRQRLSKPDAPKGFGTIGVARMLEGLPDENDLHKQLIDVAGRSIRRHLKKADRQIGETKQRLGVPDAGGLVVFMNDSEQMIDAAAIGFALKQCLEGLRFQNITSVWASVECHRIKIDGAALGFPQLHVFRRSASDAEVDYVFRLIRAWSKWNRRPMSVINHGGDWDTMSPVYATAPPTLSLFERKSQD